MAPKVLEGYIDDGHGEPLAGLTATARTVVGGSVIDTDTTDSAGHWHFADLDVDDEYFVTLEDGDGNAVVRGPWSGELRAAWVRDRLDVAGKPVALDPAAGNTLAWSAAGLYVPATDLTDYQTATEADDLYVNIAGDVVTGPLVFTQTSPAGVVWQCWDDTDAEARFTAAIDGTLRWGTGLVATDTLLARTASGVLSLGGSPLITQASGDARYEPLDSAYTKSESDARYPLLTDPDPFTQYLTQTEGDARYEPLDSAWTKAEADARFEPLDSAYTKAEADARYEPLDSAYTKTESDARYPLLTDPNPYPDYLTVTEAALLYEPLDSAYTKSEADARYEPLDSAYTKAEADARYVELAGGSVMTGLLGPTTTNTRDLGTTALRWRKLWGVDADLSGALAAASLSVNSRPVALAGCRAYNNAAISIANNTLVALTFNSERFDTDSYHDLVTNNGRLTVPAGLGGTYLIVGGVSWAPNVDANERTVTIRLNGGNYIGHTGGPAINSASVATRQQVTSIYVLAAGDYVELYVRQVSGAALDVALVSGAHSSPEFMLHRIG